MKICFCDKMIKESIQNQQYKNSTMQKDKAQNNQQFVNIKMLDFIQINPSTILNIFLHQQQQRLFVSRQRYSEIYQFGKNQQNIPVLQQIAEFQPSLYFINVNDVLALFKAFEVKLFRNERWEYHSFTSQLVSIRIVGSMVFSLHEKEVIQWHFQNGQVHFKYIQQNNAPYHIDIEGSISGFGKKVRPITKGVRLTKCQVIENKWVFVGDDKGSLHVYDWKYLSHIKTFHEHEAPILTIKISQNDDSVYFSGSDSKICMIKLIGDEWKLGQKIRGQSHDIFSLTILDNYLISGGITTDFCFYPLINGQFQGSYFHRISYCSTNRTTNFGRIVVTNNRNQFQIWSIGQNIHRTQLLVRYSLPVNKYIIDIKLFKQQIQENTLLLLVITDQDTIGWKFSEENGLVKYITIQNQYSIVQLLPKYCFLGMRNDGVLEKVNCLNGKIQELMHGEVLLPTDMQYMGSGMVLIASKVFPSIHIINIRKKNVLKQFSFNEPISYIDHINSEELVIQYFNNPILYRFQIQEERQVEVAKLPVNIIRYGGWLHSVSKRDNKMIKSKLKKFWYGISEGKVVVIPNIHKEGTKKVRVKQMDRIAQVIKPTGKLLGCSLALIPYNFTKMINELPVKPVFTKKIV